MRFVYPTRYRSLAIVYYVLFVLVVMAPGPLGLPKLLSVTMVTVFLAGALFGLATYHLRTYQTIITIDADAIRIKQHRYVTAWPWSKIKSVVKTENGIIFFNERSQLYISRGLINYDTFTRALEEHIPIKPPPALPLNLTSISSREDKIQKARELFANSSFRSPYQDVARFFVIGILISVVVSLVSQ